MTLVLATTIQPDDLTVDKRDRRKIRLPIVTPINTAPRNYYDCPHTCSEHLVDAHARCAMKYTPVIDKIDCCRKSMKMRNNDEIRIAVTDAKRLRSPRPPRIASMLITNVILKTNPGLLVYEYLSS